MRFRTIICIFLLFFPVLAWAADYPEPVQKAFETMNQADLEAWAYTLTTVSRESTIVERYDPSKSESERWTLGTRDGKEPSAEDKEQYRLQKTEALEQKKEREKSQKDDEKKKSVSLELNTMIKPGSLKVLTENPAKISYSFQPQSQKDDDRKLMESLQGNLSVNKENVDRYFIEELTLSNDKPFSPAFSVKVTKFVTRMEFRPVGESGSVFPVSVSTTFQGKLFYIKTIDENVTMTFSDFSSPEGNQVSNP